MGHFDDPSTSPLTIPSVLTQPTPAGPPGFLKPYETKLDAPDNYQNPSVELTANPNEPLNTAIGLIKPNNWIHWNVSTGNQGQSINIPFEKRASNVTAYSADYWLLSTDGGKLSRTQLGVEGAAVLKLGSLRESSKSLTTKENRREETVSHS